MYRSLISIRKLMKIKGNYMRHPFPFHEEYNVEASCNSVTELLHKIALDLRNL